jgi:hypothetical protein
MRFCKFRDKHEENDHVWWSSTKHIATSTAHTFLEHLLSTANASTVASWEPSKKNLLQVVSRNMCWQSLNSIFNLFTDEGKFSRDRIHNFHSDVWWDKFHVKPCTPGDPWQFSLIVCGQALQTILFWEVSFFRHIPLWLLSMFPYKTSFQSHCKVRSADQGSFMVHGWWRSATFPSCSSCSPEKCISVTTVGTAWPKSVTARSHHLNPWDHHFWGYVRTTAYAAEVSDTQDCQIQIQNGLQMIRTAPGIFQQVRRSLFICAICCDEPQGRNFTHSLSSLWCKIKFQADSQTAVKWRQKRKNKYLL